MMYECGSGVSFQSDFPIPEFPDPDLLNSWILSAAEEEESKIENLSYRFVTDEELLELNVTYLDHDTYTDILTFPYSYSPIDSDICISIDRIRDNADSHKTDVVSELLRVIIHGLLHMCGYEDDTPEKKATMRSREEHYLTKWKAI